MKNRYCTESTILEIGRGFVTDLMVTANGADAKAELFDGKNDAGKPLVTLLVKNGYSQEINFKTYPQFDSGLYLKINAATTLTNVGYRFIDWSKVTA